MDRPSWTNWDPMEVSDALSSEIDALERPESFGAFSRDSFLGSTVDRESGTDVMRADESGSFASLPAISRTRWVEAYLDAAGSGASHEDACDYADATARLSVEMLD